MNEEQKQMWRRLSEPYPQGPGTAKGTSSTRISGTTLSIDNVELNEGMTLIVGIAYDNSQGAPISIKWGNRNLMQYQTNTNANVTTAIWGLRYVQSEIHDLVAMWSASISDRNMFAYSI